MNILTDDHGFTLIELLLAMTLFSAVMVIATVGFVGMNRSFVRGAIRKDLSESSQSVTESITRAVRAEGISATPRMCDENTPDPLKCAAGWSAMCFAQTRYFWKASSTGLSKDAGPCEKSVSASAEVLLKTNYKAQALEVTKLNDNGLYRVKGLFTTKDTDALSVPSDGDVYKKTCLGRAQGNNVSTCAVEKFSFVVSSRGQ